MACALARPAPKLQPLNLTSFTIIVRILLFLYVTITIFTINIVIATMITFLVALLTAIDLTFYRTLLEP